MFSSMRACGFVLASINSSEQGFDVNICLLSHCSVDSINIEMS